MFVISVDLGQSQDATAVAVVERTGDGPTRRYAVRWLERWLGVPYPEQVDRIGALLEEPELAEARLVLDRTGVGRAVFDMFAEAGYRPIGVTLHGGNAVHQDGDAWSVPKRDVVFAAVRVLQSRQLDIPRELPEAAVLVSELQNFRMEVNPATAHDSYAAWREGAHDDALLAVAMGVWSFESGACAPVGIWFL